MQLKSPQPEFFGHPCANPDSFGKNAAETETSFGNPARALVNAPEPQEVVRWTILKYHVLWFLAFFGIYASSSVCPFCGTPGCPVGVGGAALVVGACACVWQYGKSAWEKLTGFLTKSSR